MESKVCVFLRMYSTWLSFSRILSALLMVSLNLATSCGSDQYEAWNRLVNTGPSSSSSSLSLSFSLPSFFFKALRRLLVAAGFFFVVGFVGFLRLFCPQGWAASSPLLLRF